jgi:hypothetical protein
MCTYVHKSCERYWLLNNIDIEIIYSSHSSIGYVSYTLCTKRVNNSANLLLMNLLGHVSTLPVPTFIQRNHCVLLLLLIVLKHFNARHFFLMHYVHTNEKNNVCRTLWNEKNVCRTLWNRVTHCITTSESAYAYTIFFNITTYAIL